jgi:hypothetical protein
MDISYKNNGINISTKEKWQYHKIKMLLLYLAFIDNSFPTPKDYGLELYYKQRNKLIELHKNIKLR